MKKMLFVFLIITTSVFAQAVIYQSNFAVGKSYWKTISPGGICDTITTLYGIHPKGETKMLHISNGAAGLSYLALYNLNLQSGHPYNITFWFNKVSGNTQDTIAICTDTVSSGFPITTNLSGTTKTGININPQGMSDANWRKISINQTPTVSGTSYLYFFQGLYNEAFLDSVVVKDNTPTALKRLRVRR